MSELEAHSLSFMGVLSCNLLHDDAPFVNKTISTSAVRALLEGGGEAETNLREIIARFSAVVT